MSPEEHSEIEQHDQVGLPLAQSEEHEEPQDHHGELGDNAEEGDGNPARRSLGKHSDRRDVYRDTADRTEVEFNEA
jgi:hypothetical protein